MSDNKKSGGHHDNKETMTHYLIMIGLFLVIAFSFYTFVIPSMVRGAVVFLFRPDGVTKTIPLSEYNGVNDKEKEHLKHVALINVDGVISEAGPDAAKFQEGAGKPLKGVINSEYIFDLSNGTRTEELDGYSKLESEWILKAPKLGEYAIVIEPALGFTILAFVVGFAGSLLITLVMPPAIGYMANKVRREIHHTKSKIRLQTGFSDDIVEILSLPDNQLADLEVDERRKIELAFKKIWDRTTESNDSHGNNNVRFSSVFDDNTDVVDFRNEMIFLRMQEFFSDFVVKEISDTMRAQEWEKK